MKLLLIEDHPFMRLIQGRMVRQPYPTCEIIEADNAEQGLFLALNEPVDLIVLDLCLPATKGGRESFKQGLNILEALQILPDAPPIMVMSGLTRETIAALALHRGAAAVVRKSSNRAEFLEAMERCLHGKTLTSGDKSRVPGGETSSAVTPADLDITARMFDVLQLALQGHPTKIIAWMLDMTDCNVRRYLSRLYAKFGVTSINGLLAHFALSGQMKGIIGSPEDRAAE